MQRKVGGCMTLLNITRGRRGRGLSCRGLKAWNWPKMHSFVVKMGRLVDFWVDLGNYCIVLNYMIQYKYD